MKRILMLVSVVAMMGSASAQTELLKDGSFEEYSCNMFGCAWDEWTMPLGLGSAETTDKLDGSVSLKTSGAVAGYLDQPVALSDEAYPAKRIFKITLNYKVLSMPESGTLKTDCYWEPKPGGDAEKMKEHDADVLQRDLDSEVSENWKQVVIETSKPEKSSYVRIRVKMPKKAEVLWDAFSVVETDKMAQDTIPVAPQDPDTTAQWTQDFVWDLSAPLTYLDEGFDRATHNQPLAINGWQNIAAVDARPWWGFDASKTQIFDEEFKSAKATAYQFGKESTGNWEMWLVTPALDYRNTENKVFRFSVMGQYLPEEQQEEPATKLEVYFIDPLGEPSAYFQNLTESFSIPMTAAEGEEWIKFVLDLTPYAATMPDVFYIAFRYAGPNGNEGVVTYYVDDVSWGVVSEGVFSSQYSVVSIQKVLRDGQIVIRKNGVEYNVLGTRL